MECWNVYQNMHKVSFFNVTYDMTVSMKTVIKLSHFVGFIWKFISVLHSKTSASFNFQRKYNRKLPFIYFILGEF